MKNLKKLFLLCPVAFVVMFMTGCTVSPDIGHEAVLIQKPLIFGHGGVDPTPVKTGLAFIAPSTDTVDVNMQPQQYEVQFDDLMSKDGVPLDFDAVIRVQVTDSYRLINNFGEKWWDNDVEREFSNRVRQAVRKYDSNEAAINTSAIDKIDDEVTNGMISYFESAHIPVKLVQVTVGKANPPDLIKNQRIETAQQEQRIQTEQQRKLAEDSRKAAELSRADADNAFRNAMGMSSEQYLRLEQIKMMRDVCGPHGGAKCTFISNGSSSSPILDAR